MFLNFTNWLKHEDCQDNVRWLNVAFLIICIVLFSSFVIYPIILTSFDISSLPQVIKILLAISPQIIMLLAIPGILIYTKQGKYLKERLSLKNWQWRYIPIAVFISMLMYPFVVSITLIFQMILSIMKIAPEKSKVADILLNSEPLTLVIFSFVAIILAPITEELIFRRIIFGFLNKYIGTIGAILFTSALFALVHMQLLGLPALFMLGVVLQIIYIKCKSIYPCMLLHFTHNAVTIGILLLVKLLSDIYKFPIF